MASETVSDTLIVGGGIAGLSLAGYLARQGHRPEIVEQASSWRSGYGIGLWESGLSVLAELGVLERARKFGVDPDSFAVRDANGDRLTTSSLSADEQFLSIIRRSDLHAALRECVPDEWITMGRSVERVDERADGVAVTFGDGTTATYDAVVGADGVHSSVREQCFDRWRLSERDTYVWYLWDEQTVDIDHDMVSVWGPESEAFVGRIDRHVGFNLAVVRDSPPNRPDGEAFRDAVDSIGWKLPRLVELADRKPHLTRVHETTCDRWHTDRVVLLGDAAHAVHPVSGMGASLALRDARTLAQELGTARPGEYRSAFERFEQRRRGDARTIRYLSRFETALSFVDSDALRAVRNRLVQFGPVVSAFLALQRAK